MLRRMLAIIGWIVAGAAVVVFGLHQGLHHPLDQPPDGYRVLPTSNPPPSYPASGLPAGSVCPNPLNTDPPSCANAYADGRVSGDQLKARWFVNTRDNTERANTVLLAARFDPLGSTAEFKCSAQNASVTWFKAYLHRTPDAAEHHNNEHVVSVLLGNESDHFAVMPDGSLVPQPGDDSDVSILFSTDDFDAVAIYGTFISPRQGEASPISEEYPLLT